MQILKSSTMDVLRMLEVIDSDEDEEIISFIEYERKPYTVRERLNLFEELSDEEFFTRFRLKKETVLIVLSKIDRQLESVSDRNHSISPTQQLLVALRFYATGCFLMLAGDMIRISPSAASKIVRKVTFAIAKLCSQYIKMPSTDNECMLAKTAFYRKAKLPRVIGSLDCTHVKIQSPGGSNAELFRNRKGYFSLNVQTVASTDLKILDIVARWPGSTHDQIIFDNCALKRRFINNEFGNSLLVADSGYANSQHVITPLFQPNTRIGELYNESVTRTRNPVERQYGVWKRRFPVLALGLRLKLSTSMAVIVATAVLHNIAIEAKEEVPQHESGLNIDANLYNEDIISENPPSEFLNARDMLLTDYFPQLL